MKWIYKIGIILFILCLLLSGIGYLVIRFYGPKLTVEILSQKFNQPVELGAIQYVFPFGVKVRSLKIKDCLEVQHAYLQLGLSDIWRRRLHFFVAHLNQPKIFLTRTIDAKIMFGRQYSSQDQQNTSLKDDFLKENAALPSPSGLPQDWALQFDSLVVLEGELIFEDVAEEKNLSFRLESFSLTVQDIGWPLYKTQTMFEAKTRFFKDDLFISGGQVHIKGDADFLNKDMNTHIEISDLLSKPMIKTSLVSRNNDMLVDGQVFIQNLLKKEKPDSQNDSIKDLLVGALQSSPLAMIANFRWKTKMDHFELEGISFEKNVSLPADGFKE